MSSRDWEKGKETCTHREIEIEWDAVDRADRIKPTQTEETYISESEHDQGGHYPNRKKPKSTTDNEDLSQPWLCEETDPFTLRIRNFEFPKRIRMSCNIKTYDGSGDPEDHLKIFQTTAKIEMWAMPRWCHMFNFTLIGATRFWFDKLPPESIDSYVALRKAFLANFLQQKKYTKDLVEIHHIKQREGESTTGSQTQSW
ncbi:reverse transcriptase domain-containing protein [Tanacetum coccineum]